jgi:hypothetical protein
MIKTIIEGWSEILRNGLARSGVLIIMTDGAIWFHPYSGGKPERRY